MKLATYMRGGRESYGVVVAQAVVGSVEQAQELMAGSPDVVDGEVVEEQ